ncbi:methyltransferase domain-containing protein [Helicobacter sp. 11S03491-1]|uniref:class I SAM-dependent methyltransferase n=1 Tax=Helicobacter sp. 11S03491-1 TaxID=1476196 RepID=UPI000BA5E5D0|nr:methyltransferase domain-containing protein [Helicobacter sp. 11S03491-1]PAF43794.1 hypothetical protein BKH45_00575 [Helicobacter sp. 11S03491-1]
MKCPLCHEQDCITQEIIQKNDLYDLYKKVFHIDISSMINSDIIYAYCKHCDLRFFLDSNGQMPTGDDSFYSALNQLHWYYMGEKNEYKFAKNYINPTDKVLEVGCGKGAFAKYLPTKDYTGLEFSTQAKKMAAKEGICIENISIEEYAQTHQNNFDVVCSFQVLEHVSDPGSFLQSKLEVLKKGGLMIIAIPSEDSFAKDWVNNILNMPPHHVSRFSDRCLESVAHIFNLKLCEIYHENVQPEHTQYYKSVIWAKKFLPLSPLIDRKLKRKIINRLGKIGTKFIQIPQNAYGHTVLAVYKKN